MHQQAGCDERGRFFSSKMHRWKMIPSYDAVPDAGFPNDRDTRFRQGCDVPINRPDTSSKLIGKILGPGHPAPLEIDQDSATSVAAIHSSYFIFFFILDKSVAHQLRSMSI